MIISDLWLSLIFANAEVQVTPGRAIIPSLARFLIVCLGTGSVGTPGTRTGGVTLATSKH